MAAFPDVCCPVASAPPPSHQHLLFYISNPEPHEIAEDTGRHLAQLSVVGPKQRCSREGLRDPTARRYCRLPAPVRLARRDTMFVQSPWVNLKTTTVLFACSSYPAARMIELYMWNVICHICSVIRGDNDSHVNLLSNLFSQYCPF